MFPNERRHLIHTLESLTESDFLYFVTLYYGVNHKPSMYDSLRNKVSNLVGWAESVNGPGLLTLAKDLQSYLGLATPFFTQATVTAATDSAGSKPSHSSAIIQEISPMPQNDRLQIIDELQNLPTSYLKSFISRYYGPTYKPFNGENHEIIDKFLEWASLKEVSILSIRANLVDYKARYGGGSGGNSITQPANPSNSSATASKQTVTQKNDDDLYDWTESDSGRLKDAISRLSLFRESSRTDFLRPIIADQVRNNPWSEFIQNPSVREFENSFVDEIMHKKSRVLLKRLLEATLRRSLSETDKTWLNAKLATI